MYFTQDVIQTFSQYRQSYNHQPEAGGILLGRRRGRHFEIVHATSPFPCDKQWRTGFVRERNGHQAKATQLWIDNNGKVGYVGEWHTHPQYAPTPSAIDYQEWRQLISGRRQSEPLVVTIVGIASLYVAVLTQGQINPLVEVNDKVDS